MIAVRSVGLGQGKSGFGRLSHLALSNLDKINIMNIIKKFYIERYNLVSIFK